MESRHGEKETEVGRKGKRKKMVQKQTKNDAGFNPKKKRKSHLETGVRKVLWSFPGFMMPSGGKNAGHFSTTGWKHLFRTAPEHLIPLKTPSKNFGRLRRIFTSLFTE